MLNMINRSWAEIDLNQIRENYRIYKEQLPEGMKVMAVVKAEAVPRMTLQKKPAR